MSIGFSTCSLLRLITKVNFCLFLEPAGLPRVLFDDDDDDFEWEEESIASLKVLSSEEESGVDDRGVTLLGWTIVKVEKENEYEIWMEKWYWIVYIEWEKRKGWGIMWVC